MPSLTRCSASSIGWAPHLDEVSEGTSFWTLDVPSPLGCLSVETVGAVSFYGGPGVVHLTGSFTSVRVSRQWPDTMRVPKA